MLPGVQNNYSVPNNNQRSSYADNNTGLLVIRKLDDMAQKLRSLALLAFVGLSITLGAMLTASLAVLRIVVIHATAPIALKVVGVSLVVFLIGLASYKAYPKIVHMYNTLSYVIDR